MTVIWVSKFLVFPLSRLIKILLLDSFSRICSLLSMEPCSGQQEKYQSKPVGGPSKEVAPSKPPSLYRIAAIFQRHVYKARFRAIYSIDFGGLMGTGFFGGIFALIGLWRKKGSAIDFKERPKTAQPIGESHSETVLQPT